MRGLLGLAGSVGSFVGVPVVMQEERASEMRLRTRVRDVIFMKSRNFKFTKKSKVCLMNGPVFASFSKEKAASAGFARRLSGIKVWNQLFLFRNLGDLENKVLIGRSRS